MYLEGEERNVFRYKKAQNLTKIKLLLISARINRSVSSNRVMSWNMTKQKNLGSFTHAFQVCQTSKSRGKKYHAISSYAITHFALHRLAQSAVIKLFSTIPEPVKWKNKFFSSNRTCIGTNI